MSLSRRNREARRQVYVFADQMMSDRYSRARLEAEAADHTPPETLMMDRICKLAGFLVGVGTTLYLLGAMGHRI